MTLILNNNLTFDNLIYLNNLENHEIENIYDKIILENRIISTKSNIITNQNNNDDTNNYCIVKHSRTMCDIFMGFISDIPITKIEILKKKYNNIFDNFINFDILNNHDYNQDCNSEFIILKDYVPIKKSYDIINSNNIYILLNDNEYIKYQSHKEIYFIDYLSISHYSDIYYKLYFNSEYYDNNLYDVGVFCKTPETRHFINNLYTI